MTILVAYRHRGSPMWSHHFRVRALDWRAFYRHVRACRQTMDYAIVRRGEYREVLA